jgi:hypothetical protein
MEHAMGKEISKLAKDFDTSYNAYLHSFNDFHEQFSSWAEKGDKNALKKARSLQTAVPAALKKVLAALKAYGTAMGDMIKKKAAVFKASPDLTAKQNKIVAALQLQADVISTVGGLFNDCVATMPKK